MKKIILSLLFTSNLLANSDITNAIKKSDHKSFKNCLKETKLTNNELEIYYDLAEKRAKIREKNLLNDSYTIMKKKKANKVNGYDIFTALLAPANIYLNYKLYEENYNLDSNINRYAPDDFSTDKLILTCKFIALNFGSYFLFKFLRKLSHNVTKQNFKSKKNIYEKYADAMKIKNRIITLRESN